MFNLLFIVILAIFIQLSWSFNYPGMTCLPSKTIKLIPKDYTSLPVIMSNLSRSHLTAARMNFDWADINLDLDKIDETLEPQVEMGWGTPDFLPPQSVLDALETVAQNQTEQGSYTIHQYTRGLGHPRLVNILGQFYSILMDRQIDPHNEILVTIGASHALDLATRAFLDPGDEVILFEPYYPEYRLFVAVANAKLVFIPLKVKSGLTGASSNDWSFDPKELEAKITNNTKMILLNNPNNPIGKSYTREELSYIGYIAEKHDLVIVSDEAGMFWHYENPEHTMIGSLPGLFKRTITINSGGKMFCNTGWRIGWVIAPEDMLWAMSAISTSNVISVPTPLQMAYAIALEDELPKWQTPDSWWLKLSRFGTKSRDLVVYYLKAVGADVIVPTAGYTILANFTKLADEIDLSNLTDCRPGMRFIEYLSQKGIGVVPASIFYGPLNFWRTEYSVRITNTNTANTINEFGSILESIFTPIDNSKDFMKENDVFDDKELDDFSLPNLDIFPSAKNNIKIIPGQFLNDRKRLT